LKFWEIVQVKFGVKKILGKIKTKSRGKVNSKEKRKVPSEVSKLFGGVSLKDKFFLGVLGQSF